MADDLDGLIAALPGVKPKSGSDPLAAILFGLPSIAETAQAAIPAPAMPPGLSLPGIPKAPIPVDLMKPEELRAHRSRPLSSGEQQLVEQVSQKSAPTPVDVGPTMRGVMAMMRGAKRAASAMPAVADPGVPNAPDPGGSINDVAGGTSDVIRGGLEAALPVMPAAIAAAPVNTALALGVGTAATEGTAAGLQKLGVPEGLSSLAGDVAGIAAGGLVGHPAARKMKSTGVDSPATRFDAETRLLEATARDNPEALPKKEPAAPIEYTPPQTPPVKSFPYQRLAEKASGKPQPTASRAAMDAPVETVQQMYARLFDEAGRRHDRPTIPETGTPMEVQQAMGERERLAQKLAGKPWDELSNPERLAIDDLMSELKPAGKDAPEPPLKPETPEPLTNRPEIRRRAFEDPERQRVHEEAIRAVEADPNVYIQGYRSEFGNVFNADNAAELFSEYRSSEGNRARHHTAVHEPARWIRDEAFRQAIHDPNVEQIAFTAGGSASGKSTAVAALNDGKTAVYDSTLSDFDGSVRIIDEALAADKPVSITYVDRDPIEALQANINRARSSGGGRTTSLASMARTHAGAAKTIQQLVARYQDDPRVVFAFLRTEPGGMKPVRLEDIAQRDYTGIEERFREYFNSQRDLPAHIYDAGYGGKGIGGHRPEDAGSVAPVRKQPGTPDPGAPGVRPDEGPLDPGQPGQVAALPPAPSPILGHPASRRGVIKNPNERGAVGPSAPLTPGQQYVQELVKKREAARSGPIRKTTARVGEFYREIKAKLVDSLSPVEDAIAAAQKQHGYEIRPDHDFTNAADRSLRSRSLAGRFAEKNGLADVIKEVPNLEEFGQYLIAKHARNVEADGFGTGRDLKRDADLVAEFAPAYEPFARRIQEYDRKLLDYTVDAGLISRELADRLQAIYPDYVPLNRVFAEMEKPDNAFASTRSVASLSKQSVIQKLQGSEREIENPIGSLLNKTYDAVAQGERNKAARILAGYADLPGFETLINPTKRFGTPATATFSYLDNGRKVTVRTTPEIEAAVKSLNVENLGAWFRILTVPARVFKAGTTGVNVPFFLANIARDQQSALINSKNPIATSVLNQKLFWRSMWDVITRDKSYREMVDAAAGGSSWDVYRREPMLTAEQIRSGKTLGTRLGYRAQNPSQMWRDFESVLAKSEEYTRLQQYQGTKAELLREGRTPQDAEILAAKAARENTANFSRRGEWGQVLNAFMPYFNASIQGSRAFVRAAERQPLQTFAKVSLGVLFPVAMTTLWNLSDEKRAKAYADVRKFEKDNSFLIIPPNPTQDDRGRWNVIKVPIVPGVGDLAIPLRRWIEQAHGLDPVKFGEVVQAFLGSVTPMEPEWNATISNLLPQTTKGAVEDAANMKFFTGTPIVPDNLKHLPPEQQVRPWTSGTARKIGGALNVSPIRVEEFTKATLGGVGTQVLNAADRALAATGQIPENRVGGTDVAEASAARFTKAAGGELQSREYEQRTEIEKKLRTAIRSGDHAERRRLEAEARDNGMDARSLAEIRRLSKLSDAELLITEMSLRDAIAQFQKLSPDEQGKARLILQRRLLKARGLQPYLRDQVERMGFRLRPAGHPASR